MAGVRVMAIGITNAVDEANLFDTVSKPIEENYIHANNFAGLAPLIGRVLSDVCQVLLTTSKLAFIYLSVFRNALSFIINHHKAKIHTSN